MKTWLYKGFKFGLLLQFAVGPVCLFVFNTSTSAGFLQGGSIALAAALIDALYIVLSGVGVAVLINRRGVKVILKVFGSLILILFGADTILSAMHIAFLPAFHLFHASTNSSYFIQGLLVTASNPLTILFWSGIFSAQVAENDLSKIELLAYSIGCVSATLIFLTAVAGLGSLLHNFLPAWAVDGLNFAVGILLIFFGVRMVLKRDKPASAPTQKVA